MSSYHRSGHSRISVKGNTHWVSDHDVSRLNYSERGNFISREKMLRKQTPFPMDREKLESYTHPNAKCPVCKSPVYFYQSPDGGRVFFDHLGPPWPKHPCTDNSSHRFIARHSATIETKPLWQINGWRPALKFSLSRTLSAQDIYEVSIVNPNLKNWDGLRLFFVSNAEILQYPPSLAFYKILDSSYRINFWREQGEFMEFLAHEEIPQDYPYPEDKPSK